MTRTYRIFQAAALILGTSLVCWAQGDAGIVSNLFRKGEAAYQKREYGAFLEAMEQAWQVAPDQPDVLYGLARASALAGKSAQAIKALDKLAAMDLGWNAPQDPDLASLRDLPGFRSFLAKLDKERRPVAKSVPAFTLTERDLFPEGIAYDPVSGAFYLTSVAKRKIVVRDKSGAVSDFISPGQDGFLSGLGIKVDAQRRMLWVCTADTPRMEGHGPATAGLSGVFTYDLATKKLLKKFVLDATTGPHMLNDLVLTSQGGAYVTDSLAGAVYSIAPGQDNLLLLTPYGYYLAPNGIALSPDESRLFVAYAGGVATVNLKTGERGELAHPAKMALGGMDGMAFYRDSLIGIQSDARRVARFFLNKAMDKVDRMEVLEAHNPLFAGIPTTGTLDGDAFVYIADSQVNAVGSDGRFLPADKLQDIQVLKVALAP